MQRGAIRFALAIAALPMLGGCVAAAIPLVAGGAMLRGDGKETGTAAEAGPADIASDSIETVAAPSAKSNSVELAAVNDGADPVADTPTPPENPVVVATERETTTELPASTGRTASHITLPTGPLDYRAYDVLYNYVELQSRRDPVDNPRQSAVLAAPGTLNPARTDCSIRPPAIVIDLDPADSIFDPAITPSPNPALGQVLASLRLQEVDVMWISRLPAVEAGDVRKVLIESQLDSQGRDQMLLMRNADDRKQVRRRELSETHCLLAIAGDNRADFDELYLYLRDETSAQPLEELIGSGWFLTPLPLTPQPPIERQDP